MCWWGQIESAHSLIEGANWWETKLGVCSRLLSYNPWIELGNCSQFVMICHKLLCLKETLNIVFQVLKKSMTNRPYILLHTVSFLWHILEEMWQVCDKSSKSLYVTSRYFSNAALLKQTRAGSNYTKSLQLQLLWKINFNYNYTTIMLYSITITKP